MTYSQRTKFLLSWLEKRINKQREFTRDYLVIVKVSLLQEESEGFP